jgi:hypothetical protein
MGYHHKTLYRFTQACEATGPRKRAVSHGIGNLGGCTIPCMLVQQFLLQAHQLRLVGRFFVRLWGPCSSYCLVKTPFLRRGYR